MQFIKHLFSALLLSLLVTSFAGCGEKPAQTDVIKVGTIAGPETELMEVAQQVAEQKNGLKVEIITFTDYAIPNAALADGSIDANMIQHKPYLDESIAQHGYKLVIVGKTFVYPVGIYSKKIKHLDELKEGATVAIPNDPSNEARALLLLESAKLIKLKPGVSVLATPADIIENPKNLKFKELEASQLTRALPDVDIAVINTNYSVIAGLLPSRDALFVESADSPYANIIVVREGSQNDPRVKQLVDALHSSKVLKKAEELFQGQAIPAWK